MEKAFRWLDQKAYDPEALGYYSHIILGDYDSADTSATAFLATLGWGQIGGKDQNTSIHLLEAFTNVYQVWPDELVRQRLEEMLHLVRDTMVRPEG